MDYQQLKNRGAALITALLVVAIVATIATILAVTEKRSIDDTSLMQQNVQAELDTQGILYWAETLYENSQRTKQALVLPQSSELNRDFYGARIEGRMDDAQALFNINSLADYKSQRTFVRLLTAVDPKITPMQASLLATNISNWLHPSSADEEYLKFNPPYRAPHFIMSDISELNLVSGITPEIYAALKPYIIALPNTENKLNILSLPKALMFALSDAINSEQVQALLDCQQRAKQSTAPATNIQTCLANLQIQLDPAITIVTDSNYILVSGQIIFPDRTLNYQSLLQPDAKSPVPRLQQLWQTIHFE